MLAAVVQLAMAVPSFRAGGTFGLAATSSATAAPAVLFVTEALKIQGETGGKTPPRADGSCACPVHPARSFCPLHRTPGQCDEASHKPCKHGGHCAPAPPHAGGVPVSTMNHSVTVDSNGGTVVLTVQAKYESCKNQQRPPSTINTINTWSNVSRMGPPGAPQSLYSPSSKRAKVSELPSFTFCVHPEILFYFKNLESAGVLFCHLLSIRHLLFCCCICCMLSLAASGYQAQCPLSARTVS